MSTLLYKVGKIAFRKPWYFIAAWVVILGVVLSMIGANGVHVSTEMKIEGTESQRILDQLSKELPAASGGQGSVVFKAPEGERLDTPERLAAISKAVSDVYGIKDVINPADYAAQMANSAAAGAGAAAQGDGGGQAAGQTAAGQTAGDQTAAGQAAAGQAVLPQDAAGQTDASGLAAQQAAAQQAAPYGPLMAGDTPVPGVMLSSSGNVALFQFQFTVAQDSLPKEVVNAVLDAVKNAGQGTGITVLPSDSLKSGISLGDSSEVVGLVVAAVVLLMTLGSVVAAGLPLLTALLGVGIGVGGAFSVSSFINMPSVTSVLALMVGLAVGIDYALFIVNRQRRLVLDQGLKAGEAAGRAVGTAGSAVFFAGLTVIIALCGMLVIGITFLSTMALVAAITVLISVFIALTLLPALLGLVGERICSAKVRERSKRRRQEQRRGFADRWINGVIKFRWVLIAAIIVVLGAAATPALKMDLGIPGAASANKDTVARQSYDAITQGFGEGFNGPLVVVAEPTGPSAKVTPELLGSLTQGLQKQENVAQVSMLGVNQNGNLAIFNLIPKTGPTDTDTKTLVNELRDPGLNLAQTLNVKLGVTGFTAVNIDMSAKLADVFPIYVGIIVVLSIIILLLVFRSLIVPIKATVGFLLSILATFGITTGVFQWGWLHSLFGFDNGGPLLSFMPIVITGILYGLAMDYQVFLVSSMREAYVHGHRGMESIAYGYKQAARVVLGAATIMVAVFAGFIFTEDIMIKQIGLTLTLGIFIDAFIVRMILVPAVMAVFGSKAWWLPKWLDRLLPNLDVEGDKLVAKLNQERHE